MPELEAVLNVPRVDFQAQVIHLGTVGLVPFVSATVRVQVSTMAASSVCWSIASGRALAVNATSTPVPPQGPTLS